MAWKEMSYQLTGLPPGLIPHSDQTANPLNPYARAIKQLTAKKKKVEADHIEVARIEFAAALYLDEELGPVIPFANIDGMIQHAAMKSREGAYAKAGVFCYDNAQLEYDGPRTVEELWADEKFRLVKAVKGGGVGGGRVMRCRPLFTKWQATIKFTVDDEVIGLDRVASWMVIAGTQVGLCDWRPRYGRFIAKRL
jgi:hypothetical protein